MGRRGFALFEMLLVVAILGIVALVIVPSFSSYKDEQKLILATSEVADALRYARSQAMRTGAKARVMLNTGSEELGVSDDGTGIPFYHPAGKQPYVTSFESSSLLKGVDMVSVAGVTGVSNIRFRSDGVPVDAAGQPVGADISIVLTHAGQSSNVVVAEGTGRVIEQ